MEIIKNISDSCFSYYFYPGLCFILIRLKRVAIELFITKFMNTMYKGMYVYSIHKGFQESNWGLFSLVKYSYNTTKKNAITRDTIILNIT